LMELDALFLPRCYGEGDREAVEGGPSVTPSLRYGAPPPP